MEHAAVAVSVRTISAGKFRRYEHLTFWQHFTVPGVIFGNLRDIFKIALGFLQSFYLLVVRRPDVVFAKGGYVCLPLGIMAKLLRVPLVIHDSDVRPGLTNRILAKRATVIATGSPIENYPYDKAKTQYVGVPIGDDFIPVTSDKQRQLKEKLGFSPDQKLVVATGGGLGAASINHAMIQVAPILQQHDINVFLVAGKKHYDELMCHSDLPKNLKIVPFIYEGMADVLGAGDVVVARGSATFLQELAGLEKAVIVVPARQLGDQKKNAAMYAAANAAIVKPDNVQLGKNDDFSDTIIGLLRDDTYRTALAHNLHIFARPNAARDLAVILVDVVAQKKP